MRTLGLLLAAFLTTSCAPTYPKEQLAQSVEQLCQREYSLSVKAKYAETTLGVLVLIPGLVEELMKHPPGVPPPLWTDGVYEDDRFQFQFATRGAFARKEEKEEDGSGPKKETERSEALKILDHVHTALRRVALSTDARLEFYTLVARDPGPTALDVIFSGHVNDLKRVQFFDISIGELQKRSRFSVRVQPEAVARQTVRSFLTDLSVRPLPQLLTRYAAPSKRFGELLPKFLELGVNLQGKEKQLLSETWPVAQTKANEAVVQVPLAPMGTPGALLFVVELRENQGLFLDIERQEGAALPPRFRHVGVPEKWNGSFYMEPIVLPKFLAEQIARRVLSEFEPLEEEQEKKPSSKEKEPASSEDVTRALVQASAYVLKSYQFSGFKELSVTDATEGTRWVVPSKELPLFRRRNPPDLKPISP